MTTKISTYVSRFHAASAKEDEAIVTRIQAVNGLTRVHSLKPADASRALFSLSADAKLESRHTAPVSHATTVAKVIDAFGFNVLDTAAKGDPLFIAIRSAFRVSTGRVQAKRLAAAAAESAKKVEGKSPATRAKAIADMADTLLAPSPRKVVTADQRAKGKPAEVTPANAVPTVAVPATLPELIAELERQLKLVSPDKVGPYLGKLSSIVNRARADVAKIEAAQAEKVSTAKAARTAKGKRAS